MKITFGRVRKPGYTDDFTVSVSVGGEEVGTLARLQGAREWSFGTDLEEFTGQDCGGCTLAEAKKAATEALRAKLDAKMSEEDRLASEGIACGFLPPDWREFERSMELSR